MVSVRRFLTMTMALTAALMLAATAFLVARVATHPGGSPAAPAPTPASTWSVDLNELDPLPTGQGDDQLAHAEAADGVVTVPMSNQKYQAEVVVEGPNAPGAQAPAVLAPAPRGQANVLSIPALGVRTKVTSTGNSHDAMTAGTNVRQVTWLDSSSALSASHGSTVLTGPVSSPQQGPGTLYDLYRVPAGAQVWTTDAAGRATQWRVTSRQHVSNAAPPRKLVATTGERKLVLITCGGAISTSTHGQQQCASNVIVVAEPIT